VLLGPSDANPSVEFWSRRRLPFESKEPEFREMRSRLQAAVSAIPSRADFILGAQYVSEDRSRFDVENTLIYNVGVRKWTAAAAGIRFERGFGRPSSPPDGRAGFDHYHRYELIPASLRCQNWTPGPTLGRFEVSGLGSRPPTGPAELWLAIRRGDTGVADGAGGLDGPFGVRVTLVTPRSMHPVPVLKSILDAVVSAFHVHSGGPSLRAAATRIAERLSISEDEVADVLSDPRLGLLGAVDLVRPYRSYVMWNPSDDRCVAAQVLTHGGGPSGRWLLRGELFGVHHAE
jgi:hypothetical protein